MNQFAALIYITTNFINKMSTLVQTEQQRNELYNFANTVKIIIDSYEKQEQENPKQKEVNDDGKSEL